jgi:tetratricopeptide (TPR) repeat protein
MSARTRVRAIVAALACLAAGAVVAVVAVQTRGDTRGSVNVAKPLRGFPPLRLDLGVRIDREAQDLRRGEDLYSRGKHADAEAIFARYRSAPAEIGAAFARWDDDGLEHAKEVVAAHPKDPQAQLHLAIAYLWAGRRADALAAFRRTRSLYPDTQSAVTAADFLFQGPPGVPPFVPTFGPSESVAALPPPARLAALARAAERPDARAKLLYGTALQSLGRTVSAEREFSAAARLAPKDPQARVAAALGRFDKADPGRVFPQLGPLVRVFPHAPTVRFHLGLALFWLGNAKEAEAQLRKVVAEAPDSPLGRQAETLLERLASPGTK